MSLGFRHSTAFAGCLFARPPAYQASLRTHLRGKGILTCAIISSALWTFFCSAAESNWGFFGFVSVPAWSGSSQWVLEFYDHKSFTSQMDDSNKSRHTHAHIYTCSQGHTTLTWRGVAWLGYFITRTHIAHTQRWPQASFASSGLVGCTN